MNRWCHFGNNATTASVKMCMYFSHTNLLSPIVMVAISSGKYLRWVNNMVHAWIPIIYPISKVAVACVVTFCATTLKLPPSVFSPIIMDTEHTSKNFVSWALKWQWLIVLIHPTCPVAIWEQGVCKNSATVPLPTTVFPSIVMVTFDLIKSLVIMLTMNT